METEYEILNSQYQTAIKARDTLNDNFYKWMSYYYVANAAMIVAVTTYIGKVIDHLALFYLGIIGAVICSLWHLSCKGYYYWSNNWIYQILRIEKELENITKKPGVYSVFSKNVAEKQDHIAIPNESANVSTPKLTLLFSFLIFGCWISFTMMQFFALHPEFQTCQYTLSILVCIILVYVIYVLILPRFIRSRMTDLHKLV